MQRSWSGTSSSTVAIGVASVAAFVAGVVASGAAFALPASWFTFAVVVLFAMLFVKIVWLAMFDTLATIRLWHFLPNSMFPVNVRGRCWKVIFGNLVQLHHRVWIVFNIF